MNSFPKTSGIYLISFDNGKNYVGQAQNLNNRIIGHLRTVERYTNRRSLVHKAMLIHKYEISILEECSINALDDREIFWIEKLKSYKGDYPETGYNLTTGGKSGGRGIKHKKDKYHDAAVLREARLRDLGGGCKFINDETRKKLSASNSKPKDHYTITEKRKEADIKGGITRSGAGNPSRKKVYCYTSNIMFETVIEAINYCYSLTSNVSKHKITKLISIAKDNTIFNVGNLVMTKLSIGSNRIPMMGEFNSSSSNSTF